MAFKEILSAKTGLPGELLPAGYQIIGSILLVKLNPKLNRKTKKKIAGAMLQMMPYIDTVCESLGVEGELRKPSVKILSSRLKKPSTITVHKENDILFKLDVGKIMFSKGNLNERQRLIGKIRPGEVVVDMFAGIGYFSLGIAKFSPAERIYAIEKSPSSYKYLKENIRLNKLNKITPLLGDCRRIRKRISADRIIMGYLPHTEKYLPLAFKFLKSQGVIHYHNTYLESELWLKPLEQLDSAAKKSGYKITAVLGRNIVKSYAPRVFHIVMDAAFERVHSAQSA
ncbi:MAG: class I SAM-dependent methyltransferase family protein [Candidatus Aenigmarchaeota archaeon]|nr:class I SAM-dependent methyltransferase family protein [Candidatus Aenigmarchaeota archaeon]